MEASLKFNDEMFNKSTIDPNTIYVYVDYLNNTELVIDCPNLRRRDFISSMELAVYINVHQPELHLASPETEFCCFPKLDFYLFVVPTSVPYRGGVKVFYNVYCVDFAPAGSKVLFCHSYEDHTVAHRVFMDWIFYYNRFENKL